MSECLQRAYCSSSIVDFTVRATEQSLRLVCTLAAVSALGFIAVLAIDFVTVYAADFVIISAADFVAVAVVIVTAGRNVVGT